MMTEQIGDFEASASSESDEHGPTNRELSGQARSVERTYQRCVQRVEVQVDEKWRQEYSAFGYALDGTGAVGFGLIGAGGVTAGIVNSEDDGATANLVVGSVFSKAAPNTSTSLPRGASSVQMSTGCVAVSRRYYPHRLYAV
ncbi:MAG: hypothetical protein ACLFVJ_22080 [Persicimonas sp.]